MGGNQRAGYVPRQYASSSIWKKTDGGEFEKIETFKENISVLDNKYVLSSFIVAQEDLEESKHLLVSIYSSQFPFWVKLKLIKQNSEWILQSAIEQNLNEVH